MGIFHQSTFSRDLANAYKAGAYYTDQEMCKRLGFLLSLPDRSVTYEPSIGDGNAVISVLEGAQADFSKANIFACELDKAVAEKTRERLQGLSPDNVLLNEDCCEGIAVSYNSFSMVFMNPPYGDDPDLKIRLETKHMQKVYPYLKKDGVILIVVPSYIVADADKKVFLKPFIKRFELVGAYRFDDDKYEQFKQVVLIGRKRNRMLDDRSSAVGEEDTLFEKELSDAFERLKDISKWPYLPKGPIVQDKRVMVPQAKAEDVQKFTTKKFDAFGAAKALKDSPLYSRVSDSLGVEAYVACSIGRPVLPLSPSHSYLAGVCGAGQGSCGNEESGDYHLQRGVVTRVETGELRQSENGKSAVVAVTSTSNAELVILEQSGRISRLK